jgi:hypothetical protein
MNNKKTTLLTEEFQILIAKSYLPRQNQYL